MVKLQEIFASFADHPIIRYETKADKEYHRTSSAHFTKTGRGQAGHHPGPKRSDDGVERNDTQGSQVARG
jgi:hypothetical protein